MTTRGKTVSIILAVIVILALVGVGTGLWQTRQKALSQNLPNFNNMVTQMPSGYIKNVSLNNVNHQIYLVVEPQSDNDRSVFLNNCQTLANQTTVSCLANTNIEVDLKPLSRPEVTQVLFGSKPGTALDMLSLSYTNVPFDFYFSGNTVDKIAERQ